MLLVKDAITVGGRLNLEAMILKDGGLASSRTARAKSVRIFWSRVPRPLKRDRVSGHPTLGLYFQPEIGSIFDMFCCL